MSDNTDQPAPEPTPPAPPSPATARRAGGSDAQPAARQGDPIADARNADFVEALKREAEKSRLSPELKAQILAELPPLEEHERLYREMQEHGGLSFEQFCEGLGIEVKPES
jgi:hypothetical protein